MTDHDENDFILRVVIMMIAAALFFTSLFIVMLYLLVQVWKAMQ